MNQRRNGLKVLGVASVAVLGLMAFVASGAQANFLVLLTEGGVVDDAGDNLPVISAHTEVTKLIAKKNLEIKCTTAESDPTAPVLLLANSAVAHGHLIFSGCKTFSISPLTESPKCKPWSPGQAVESGKILAGGLAELILHNAKTYLLFKPLTGSAFTTLEFGPECALTESSELTGSFVAECGELNVEKKFVGGDCATHRVTQLLRQAPAALFEADKLMFGKNEALLDGIVAVKLGAPFVGKSWGAVV